MARIKQSIIQRDFSAGELREDFLDADDLEVRGKSLKTATNVRILATRTVEARPGSVWIKDEAGAVIEQEITPADGQRFLVVVCNDKVVVLNTAGVVVFTQASVAWTVAAEIWIVPDRERTIIGDWQSGLWLLEYNGTSWAYGVFAFDRDQDLSVFQPYWNFHPGVTIQPSARTGAGITITSAPGIFTTGYVGTRIRMGGREILITAYTSPTQIIGTVTQSLPPFFTISVPTPTNYAAGEEVIGQTSGFTGVVTTFGAGVIGVITTENFDGPTVGEKLSGPTTTQILTAVSAPGVGPSLIWDEALMTPMHKWPRSGVAIGGRLVLTDFPDVPSMNVLSSVRSYGDYRDGVEDDDAIIRTVGDGAPRFRHAISSTDLLLFSDRGAYYVSLRDGGLLTPSTFNPILFDARGCNTVRPVRVDGGVGFVESDGQTVSVAILVGNVNLSWSIRTLTTFHNHLVKSPVALCGPALTSVVAEKYVFIVNGDGTICAASWNDNFSDVAIGFVPWETAGVWKNVTPAFDGYWAIVDRTIAGITRRMIERFDFSTLVDCASVANPNAAGAALHLAGHQVDVAWRDADAGFGMVAADGSVAGMEDVLTSAQIGLNFVAEGSPWPVEILQTTRVGMIAVRALMFLVSVQATGQFQARCNAHTRTLGGYAFNDDLAIAPPTQTKVYRVPVTGRRDHHDMAVIKHRPAKWRILYLGQEVQG